MEGKEHVLSNNLSATGNLESTMENGRTEQWTKTKILRTKAKILRTKSKILRTKAKILRTKAKILRI